MWVRRGEDDGGLETVIRALDASRCIYTYLFICDPHGQHQVFSAPPRPVLCIDYTMENTPTFPALAPSTPPSMLCCN